MILKLASWTFVKTLKLTWHESNLNAILNTSRTLLQLFKMLWFLMGGPWYLLHKIFLVLMIVIILQYRIISVQKLVRSFGKHRQTDWQTQSKTEILLRIVSDVLIFLGYKFCIQNLFYNDAEQIQVWGSSGKSLEFIE